MAEGIGEGILSETEERRIPTEKVLAGKTAEDRKTADSIIEKVKKAVFDEYDRAFMEGPGQSENRRAVELQKRHIEFVVELSRKCVEVLKEKGMQVGESQASVIEIYAYLHDAMKIVPERTRLDGEYKGTSLEHSGGDSQLTRLFMHGKDSALWAAQLLEDLGFSEEFIRKAEHDLEAHMPMPYVVERLQIERGKRERGGWPKVILPEGDYPEPESLEAAVVFAADLLATGIMAGEDIDRQPEAGCFDRLLGIDIAFLQEYGWETLEGAFELTRKGVKANVERLTNPPDKENRGEAPRVEEVLGRRLGKEMLSKLEAFYDMVNGGVEIDGEYVKGFDGSKDIPGLAAWRQVPMYGLEMKPVGEIDRVDYPGTLERYYRAVRVFREQRKGQGIDLSDIVQR